MWLASKRILAGCCDDLDYSESLVTKLLQDSHDYIDLPDVIIRVDFIELPLS